MSFEKFTGTRPVAPQHAFDAERLAAWMRAHVDAGTGTLEIAQFKGGQSNPTYLISAGTRRYALRRKPPGKLLPSAHAVDREYRVMTALRDTDVPVPKTYALCEDAEVIGTAFFIMDYVEGRVLWDPTLAELTRGERKAHYDELNRVIAALHRVDPAAVGLADYGKPGNYLARQIDRWSRQYRASETERIEAMEQLIAWLPAHVPADERPTVVHGDFRPGNLIVHPAEPRVVAVLDWELSTLGSPLADLAYNCMPYRLGPSTLGGVLGAPLAEMGLPSEAEYVATYCRRTGRSSIPDWEFYLAFAMFRLAAIAQGIMGRVIAGTANDVNARARGERARPLAEAGWETITRGPGVPAAG